MSRYCRVNSYYTTTALIATQKHERWNGGQENRLIDVRLIRYSVRWNLVTRGKSVRLFFETFQNGRAHWQWLLCDVGSAPS